MSGDTEAFIHLPEQDRRDVFESAASRLDTPPGYVEKDFGVCIVLDALFNRLPNGHPNLLFKGGTSLSKAFGLIERFPKTLILSFIVTALASQGNATRPWLAVCRTRKGQRCSMNSARRAVTTYAASCKPRL